MKATWNWIQMALSAVGDWLGWFVGGFDDSAYTLVVFMAVDYIIGILCAIVDRKLSREVCIWGIIKKMLIFVMVAIGHLVDRELSGSCEVVRSAVIFFYLSNEGVSLLENATRLGLPVPKKLRETLKQLHSKSDKDDD